MQIHNACIAMHDGHHTVPNQDNGTSLVLINLENIVVPSLHQGFVSAKSVQPCYLHNEDTNLLPKTTLEKSTMKSSGILKEKSKTKQLGFLVTTVIWPYLKKPKIYYRTQKMCQHFPSSIV